MTRFKQTLQARAGTNEGLRALAYELDKRGVRALRAALVPVLAVPITAASSWAREVTVVGVPVALLLLVVGVAIGAYGSVSRWRAQIVWGIAERAEPSPLGG